MKNLILLIMMFTAIGMPVSLYLHAPSLGIVTCLAFGIFSIIVFSMAAMLIVEKMD